MNVLQPAGEGAGAADRRLAVDLVAPASGTPEGAAGAGMASSTGPSACEVADAALGRWNAVAQALVPIIGKSSVTLLYRRSLAAVGVHRPWLPTVSSADLPDNDWKALHASVCRQAAPEAFEACALLFDSFEALLGSLIGTALTEQLLHPVSALPLDGSAGQDPPP